MIMRRHARFGRVNMIKELLAERYAICVVVEIVGVSTQKQRTKLYQPSDVKATVVACKSGFNEAFEIEECNQPGYLFPRIDDCALCRPCSQKTPEEFV